eukprot:TRINITY_DN648_c0_g1_i3.p1 TRINITY_DN648_c0_g1~~TRINITY_DN648_c0_g1_i3.p1  ORF type:complete len:521 (+),score=192.97 TRINITY_DN648_c0_g1_i3:145-1707(+)
MQRGHGSLSEQIAVLEEELAGERTLHEEKQQLYLEIFTSHSRLEEDVSTLAGEKRSLELQLETANASLEEAQARLRLQQDKRDLLENERTRLAEDLAREQERRSDADRRLDEMLEKNLLEKASEGDDSLALQSELQIAFRERDEVSRQLREKESEARRLEEQLDRSSIDVAARDREVQRIEQNTQKMDKELRDLRGEREQLVSDISHLRNTIALRAEGESDLRRALAAEQENFQMVLRELNEVKAGAELQELGGAEASRALTTARRERDELESELRLLRLRLASVTAERDETQTEVRLAQDARRLSTATSSSKRSQAAFELDETISSRSFVETHHVHVDRQSRHGSKAAIDYDETTHHVHVGRHGSKAAVDYDETTQHVHVDRQSRHGSKAAIDYDETTHHVHVGRHGSKAAVDYDETTQHVHVDRQSRHGSKAAIDYDETQHHVHIERNARGGVEVDLLAEESDEDEETPPPKERQLTEAELMRDYAPVLQEASGAAQAAAPIDLARLDEDGFSDASQY